MKKIYLTILFFLPLLSFAAWSQPTATPPAGNTQPPINTGTTDQTKQGGITAKKFCLLNNFCFEQGTNGGVSKLCLGNSCITNWNQVIDTSSFVDTSANAQVKKGLFGANNLCLYKTDGTTRIACLAPTGTNDGIALEINKKFCIGGVCITKWSDLFTSIIGPVGPVGPAGPSSNPMNCTNGQVLEWNGTKWTCGTDNTGTEVDTFDSVLARGNSTDREVLISGVLKAWSLGTVYTTIGDATSGYLKIPKGAGSGKILSSDTEGKASWKTKDELGLGGGGSSSSILEVGYVDIVQADNTNYTVTDNETWILVGSYGFWGHERVYFNGTITGKVDLTPGTWKLDTYQSINGGPNVKFINTSTGTSKEVVVKSGSGSPTWGYIWYYALRTKPKSSTPATPVAITLNDLPSGSIAGYCREGHWNYPLNHPTANTVIAPATRSGGSSSPTGYTCSCPGGWTKVVTMEGAYENLVMSDALRPRVVQCAKQ